MPLISTNNCRRTWNRYRQLNMQLPRWMICRDAGRAAARPAVVQTAAGCGGRYCQNSNQNALHGLNVNRTSP